MARRFLAPLLVACAAATFAATPFATVEANTASVAELDSIKGIGPALSARIVEARMNGEFKDWRDLIARVPGVAANSAVRLSAAGLRVNGRPHQGGTETPAASR